MRPERRSSGHVLAVIGRVIAGVISAAAAVVFVTTAWLAINSRFGSTSNDMHGYGLLFGTIAAIFAGFVLAIMAPLVFPRRLYAIAYPVSLSIFLLVFILLLVSLFTA